MTYLKFNLISSIINAFIKLPVHILIYKNKNISNDVLIYYYLFSIIRICVMFLIIKNIQNNLYNYDQYSGELIIIYSSLLSAIITMIYIEHTFHDNIKYKNNEPIEIAIGKFLVY